MMFLQGYFDAILLVLVVLCVIVELVSRVVSVAEDNSGKGLNVNAAKVENSDVVKRVGEGAGKVFVERVVREMFDVDEHQVFVERAQKGEEKFGASKIETFCCVEGEDEVGDVLKTEEVVGNNVVESNMVKDDDDDAEFGEDDGVSDDDWEGIERSDLGVLFAKAVNFVECGKYDALSNLGSELQKQLYGLQKIAMDGPCHEPQPMAFKVSARAKWNAWQRMGSMSSEVAMEQYIKLLSENVPGWTKHSANESCVDNSSAIGDTEHDTSSPDVEPDCTDQQ